MSRQIGDIPTRTFAAGDVIFREGDDAKGEAFLVHIGTVDIRIRVAGEERLVNTLKKGSLLGDFALFRNAPRSATAIAAEPVTLMVLPANRLDHMVRSNPALAMAIIKDLANRMLAGEDRARQAESRATDAEERARDLETRLAAAEEKARIAEARLTGTEGRPA